MADVTIDAVAVELRNDQATIDAVALELLSLTVTLDAIALEVSHGPTATPPSLSFSYVAGAPIAESFLVDDYDDQAVTITPGPGQPASVTDLGVVIKSSPYTTPYAIGGTAPLTPGVYTWNYTLSDPDDNQTVVPVTLTVTAAPSTGGFLDLGGRGFVPGSHFADW